MWLERRGKGATAQAKVAVGVVIAAGTVSAGAVTKTLATKAALSTANTAGVEVIVKDEEYEYNQQNIESIDDLYVDRRSGI